MARRIAKDNFHQTGLKRKGSDAREETESGQMAAYIIDRIPEEKKEFFDTYDINEVHLATAIRDSCGRYIKYCPQEGWMVYRADEGRWTDRYAEAAVQRVITHFGELLFERALETNTGEKTFARRILSSAGINAVKNILKHDVTISIEREKFDADPDLLNCMGDLYSLRDGHTRAALPEDLFSKSTAYRAAELSRDRDGNWTCPKMSKKFEAFLDKVTSKDGARRTDLVAYILQYFGYALTGDTGASFFVNFHGQGKNGKSVLLNLMLDLFGSYATALPRDIVIENRFQGQFDLAGLPGVRLAVLIDAPKGQLNMDQLKSLISGDKVKGKRKYKDDFEFTPVCKIAVGSNPKLKLSDTGLSVRRRIRMVPFDYIVSDEEAVMNLHKLLLKEEGEQILSLLIYFANKYYREGEGPKAFPACKVIDEASREYMDSQDLVGRWIKERTDTRPGPVQPGVNTESYDALYEDFKKWMGTEGIHKVMAKNTFGEHLGVKLEKKRIRQLDNELHYLNIKLKHSATSPPDTGGG